MVFQSSSCKTSLGMFYLGMAYSSGDGIPRNNDFSNRWIRAAADKGLVMAQLTLGMKLSLGDGIERNLDHGVQWLRQAANAGSSEAALQLRRFENLLVKTPKRSSSIPDNEKQAVSRLAQDSTLPKSKNKTAQASPRVPMPRKITTTPSTDPVEMALELLAIDNNEAAARKMLKEIAGQGRSDALHVSWVSSITKGRNLRRHEKISSRLHWTKTPSPSAMLELCTFSVKEPNKTMPRRRNGSRNPCFWGTTNRTVTLELPGNSISNPFLPAT